MRKIWYLAGAIILLAFSVFASVSITSEVLVKRYQMEEQDFIGTYSYSAEVDGEVQEVYLAISRKGTNHTYILYTTDEEIILEEGSAVYFEGHYMTLERVDGYLYLTSNSAGYVLFGTAEEAASLSKVSDGPVMPQGY